jgi:hypothetical protein
MGFLEVKAIPKAFSLNQVVVEELPKEVPFLVDIGIGVRGDQQKIPQHKYYPQIQDAYHRLIQVRGIYVNPACDVIDPSQITPEHADYGIPFKRQCPNVIGVIPEKDFRYEVEFYGPDRCCDKRVEQRIIDRSTGCLTLSIKRLRGNEPYVFDQQTTYYMAPEQVTRVDQLIGRQIVTENLLRGEYTMLDRLAGYLDALYEGHPLTVEVEPNPRVLQFLNELDSEDAKRRRDMNPNFDSSVSSSAYILSAKNSH